MNPQPPNPQESPPQADYGYQQYPAHPQPQQYVQHQQYPQHQSAGYPPPSFPVPVMRNGLGTAGFVLGLVGLIFSFIPIIGVVAWPLVIVGLVLAILGLLHAQRGIADNRGMAIAGIVLSAAGLAICMVYAVSFFVSMATH